MLIKTLDQWRAYCTSYYKQGEILLKNEKQLVGEPPNEFKPRRSIEQNNYYWAFNTEVAKFLDDAGCSYGEHNLPYNSELVHEINKHMFGIKSTKRLKVGDFCEYMTKLLILWQEKTAGEFFFDELPDNYLMRKGYTVY